MEWNWAPVGLTSPIVADTCKVGRPWRYLAGDLALFRWSAVFHARVDCVRGSEKREDPTSHRHNNVIVHWTFCKSGCPDVHQWSLSAGGGLYVLELVCDFCMSNMLVANQYPRHPLRRARRRRRGDLQPHTQPEPRGWLSPTLGLDRIRGIAWITLPLLPR